jgi:hypothetical protein
MLALANITKLIAEIALLALLGQWLLGLLAGAGKEGNPFYRILQTIGSPFVSLARLVSPRVVLDRHMPLVAFLMVWFLWLGATFYRIKTCLQIGVNLCT